MKGGLTYFLTSNNSNIKKDGDRELPVSVVNSNATNNVSEKSPSSSSSLDLIESSESQLHRGFLIALDPSNSKKRVSLSCASRNDNAEEVLVGRVGGEEQMKVDDNDDDDEEMKLRATSSVSVATREPANVVVVSTAEMQTSAPAGELTSEEEDIEWEDNDDDNDDEDKDEDEDEDDGDNAVGSEEGFQEMSEVQQTHLHGRQRDASSPQSSSMFTVDEGTGAFQANSFSSSSCSVATGGPIGSLILETEARSSSSSSSIAAAPENPTPKSSDFIPDYFNAAKPAIRSGSSASVSFSVPVDSMSSSSILSTAKDTAPILRMNIRETVEHEREGENEIHSIDREGN